MTKTDTGSGVLLRPRLAGEAAFAIALGVALAWAVSRPPAGLAAGTVLAIDRVAQAWPAAVMVLSAFGSARVLGRLWQGACAPFYLRVAAAGALLAWGAHVLGALGIVSAPGTWIACSIGLVMLGEEVWRNRRALMELPRMEWVWACAAPALAIAIVAWCSVPGWLWGSEFGGFDVLSYHLELPREWVERGRVWPVEHNVYSFLPSYMEAAFAQSMSLAGGGGSDTIGEQGWRLIAPQTLHCMYAVAGAWLVARAAACSLERAGCAPHAARFAGAFGGALVLATPWLVVTGSLAYNDMGVVTMLAGAWLAAVDPGLRAGARGALCGVLVGAACGIKPTAAFMVAPGIGLLLATRVPVRQWPRVGVGGVATGLLMLAPWLVRNTVACGNPVFPYATSALGRAHWSDEQVQRWTGAHHFEGSPARRATLLVARDPEANPRAPDTEQHRGFSHPQWAWLPGIGLALGVVGLAGASTRRTSFEGAAVLALQCIGWGSLTHLQSRFLLPCAVPLGVLSATGVALILDRARAAPDTPRSRSACLRWSAYAVGSGLILMQSFRTAFIYAGERSRAPTLGLVSGATFWTGEGLADPDEIAVGWLNHHRADGRVYLLGDSTPLYVSPLPVYHTTYDTSPIGEAIRANPDDPAAWSRSLGSLGVRRVLVNWSELTRLTRSGWYDPSVTPDRVRQWLASEGIVEGEWTSEARTLFRLRGAR